MHYENRVLVTSHNTALYGKGNVAVIHATKAQKGVEI
jgi:hypothetical protein